MYFVFKLNDIQTIMKINISKILVCAIGLLGFSACNEPVKKATKEKETQEINNFSRPSQALNYQEIATMIAYYDTTKRESIANSRNGKEDTWMYSYNLEDLKAYIGYVEKIAKEKNIEVTAINIRAAAYPKNHHLKEMQDYQTLIFTPATTINGKENVSFDPLYSKKGKPAVFDSIVKTYQKGTPQKKLKSVAKSSSKAMQQAPITTKDKPSVAANRIKQVPPYN